MIFRRLSPLVLIRQLQLTVATLAVPYMLLLGGAFSATFLFPLQVLNWLAGAGLAFSWLLVRLIQRRSLTRLGVELPLIVFAGSQWLAVLTSTQPRLSLDWATNVAAWSVALFILTDCLNRGWPRSFWLNALVIGAVLLAGHGLWSTVQWFAGWAALGTFPPVTFRYNGLAAQANLTACVINLLWPVVLVKLIRSTRTLGRLAWGGLLAGLAITLFFTSSRAAWLAAAASTVLLVLLLGYSHPGQAWRLALRAGWQRATTTTRLAFGAGLLVVTAAAAWLLFRESQHFTHGSLFESRTEFWSIAWSLFQSRPLVGVGPDLYAWYLPRFVSIPPGYFAGHAHSVIFQILSGSGLVGLGALFFLMAALAVRLWRGWRAAGSTVELACLIAALASFAIHGLFDFPITPLTMFLAVVLLALALSNSPASKPQPTWPPLLAAPFVLLPIGIFAFLLPSAANNAAATQLAGGRQWAAAAQLFEQASQADPHLPLYGEEAAYAYTLVGNLSAALPLWDQAVRDDPYWALAPATVGALRRDLSSAQAARRLAPQSYLYALNAGAIAEAQGDTAAAQEAYQSALSLQPSTASALYWQQSAWRQGVLSAWQSQQPRDNSLLAQGRSALGRQAYDQARSIFQQVLAEDSTSLAAYLGVGQADLQLGDLRAALQSAQLGLAMPVNSPADLTALHLLAGDVDDARGDRAGATAEYALVFDQIADYGTDGPGSYGYSVRAWSVFHLQALPADLVPQLPRADITAAMDARFAKLSAWYQADGQTGRACAVLQRVYQEAPDSISGRLYGQRCPAP